MDERGLVLEITKAVLRYVEVPQAALQEWAASVAAIPADQLPALRQTILDARARLEDAVVGRDYPDRVVVDIVRMCSERAGVQGFARGIYVGYVQEFVERPEAAPAVRQMIVEARYMIDVVLPQLPAPEATK